KTRTTTASSTLSLHDALPISNFRNPLTDTKPTIGDPWFQGSYKDFGPRIGFSWDPWSNGKTAIRGGFGMYFDHLVAQPLNRALRDRKSTRLNSSHVSISYAVF